MPLAAVVLVDQGQARVVSRVVIKEAGDGRRVHERKWMEGKKNTVSWV